jgi:tetratricopeptide (TPR) repeat protein
MRGGVWILLLGLSFTLMGCVTVQEKENLEMLPMYGTPELTRDTYLADEDAQFIRQQLTRFQGNHQTASLHFSKRANEALGYGQIQQAMVLFNRAWLLDQRNALAYWGFGQVQVLQNKPDLAIRHLEKAQALGVDRYQQSALLVDLGIAYSILAERVAPFETEHSRGLYGKANQMFEKSSRLAPNYGEVWRRWSFSLLREKRYADAWAAVHKARGLGINKFPPSFLKSLSTSLADPMSGD